MPAQEFIIPGTQVSCSVEEQRRGVARIQIFGIRNRSERVPLVFPPADLEEAAKKFINLLDDKNAFRRRAWGIPFFPGPSWRLVIEAQQDKTWSFTCHLERSLRGAWDWYRTYDTNLLTEAIKHRLNFLPVTVSNNRLGGRILARTGIKLLKTWSNPGATCVHCQRLLPVKMWKPTTCSTACTDKVERYGLGNGCGNAIAPFLSDISVLDFLLCCIYSAAPVEANLTYGYNYRDFPLLPGCPIDARVVRGVIDSFPKLVYGMDQVALEGPTDDPMWEDRHALVEWLCRTFIQGHLAVARRPHMVPGLGPDTAQFMLLNSTIEHEVGARQSVADFSRPTVDKHVVYHGTNHARLFRILSDGLKDMTKAGGGKLSRADTAGIHVTTSLGQCVRQHVGRAVHPAEWQQGRTLTPWSQSCFRALGKTYHVVLGCEMMMPLGRFDERRTEYAVMDETDIRVRYIFVLSGQAYNAVGQNVITEEHLVPTMVRAFAALDDGTFNME